jgi:hypothetical protein
VFNEDFYELFSLLENKKALVNKSDVTPLIPRQTGLQLSVPYSQRHFTLCKYWTVTFQPFLMTPMIYFVLVNNAHCQLLLFNLLFNFYSVLLFDAMLLVQLNFIVFILPSKYSVLILECVPGILIPTRTTII